MLARQTIQPDILEIVDYPPKSDQVDITERYHYGYDKLRNQWLDCVVIMEVDDWYANNYLEAMVTAWQHEGCPDMFGTNYTTYYHLRLDRSLTFRHAFRSSMMSTLIKADLDLEWPLDDYPYTDLFLWMRSKNKKTFFPKGQICMGLKHGEGLTGGQFHIDKLKMFKDKVSFVKIVGAEDYEFYRKHFPIKQTMRKNKELVFV
jgi:hypothetical protein